MSVTQRTSRSSSLPGIAIPPGETLHGELVARSLSQTAFAKLIHRPLNAVNEIIKGKKAITAETALTLEDALGIKAEVWLGLELDYQLTKARLARKVAARKRPAAARRKRSVAA